MTWRDATMSRGTKRGPRSIARATSRMAAARIKTICAMVAWRSINSLAQMRCRDARAIRSVLRITRREWRGEGEREGDVSEGGCWCWCWSLYRRWY